MELFDREQLTKDLTEINGMMPLTDNKVDFYFLLAKDWLSENKDSLYLGCGKNTVDNIVLVLYKKDTIYLLGETYKTIMYAPKLMFHRIEKNHWHIDDVLMKHNNVGNGTIAMKTFLKYAKQSGVKLITGDLSLVDNNHKERRNHYYEKFGFEVKERSIKKELR